MAVPWYHQAIMIDALGMSDPQQVIAYLQTSPHGYNLTGSEKVEIMVEWANVKHTPFDTAWYAALNPPVVSTVTQQLLAFSLGFPDPYTLIDWLHSSPFGWTLTLRQIEYFLKQWADHHNTTWQPAWTAYLDPTAKIAAKR